MNILKKKTIVKNKKNATLYYYPHLFLFGLLPLGIKRVARRYQDMGADGVCETTYDSNGKIHTHGFYSSSSLKYKKGTWMFYSKGRRICEQKRDFKGALISEVRYYQDSIQTLDLKKNKVIEIGENSSTEMTDKWQSFYQNGMMVKRCYLKSFNGFNRICIFNPENGLIQRVELYKSNPEKTAPFSVSFFDEKGRFFKQEINAPRFGEKFIKRRLESGKIEWNYGGFKGTFKAVCAQFVNDLKRGKAKDVSRQAKIAMLQSFPKMSAKKAFLLGVRFNHRGNLE